MRAHPLPNLLNNTLRTNLVNFPRLDDFEAAVAVVLVVRRAGQGRADSGVDVGVVGEQTFLSSVEEICAVVYGGLLGGGTAEDFGLPGVEVGVEVDYGDGAIFAGGASVRRPREWGEKRGRRIKRHTG